MNTTTTTSKGEHTTTTTTSKGRGGFIAIYNPGRLHARAEVHYNEDYSDPAVDAYFEAQSLDLECNIQIFDLETGKHIMLYAGRPII